MKKWNEKKDLLEKLLLDTSIPKFKEGDYSLLVKTILKLVSDSNIVVSQTSIKVISNLIKGLKKDYEPYVKDTVPLVIAKLRDRKLEADCCACLDNLLESVSIEDILDEILAGLNDKGPAGRKCTAAFLEKAILVTYIDVLTRVAPSYLAQLVKNADDTNSECRDAALGALGAFKGRFGESYMSKYLSELNP